MVTYNNTIIIQFDTDATGNAGSGKEVTVYLTGTLAKADLFDLQANPIGNPVTSDDKGNYTFNIDAGFYDIYIDQGLPSQTIIHNEPIAVSTDDDVAIEEIITLNAGQTTVVFSTIDTQTAGFYVGNTSNDRGRLINTIDYTVTNPTTIELTSSYPQDTPCLGVSFQGGGLVSSNQLNFLTLSSAQNNPDAVNGGIAITKERTTGDGGGAIWDYVLESTVGINGFDIVACLSIPTLALVLRKPNSDPRAWGMANSAADNSGAFARILASEQPDFEFTGSFNITSAVSVTLIADKTLSGTGFIKWNSTALLDYMTHIDLAGFNIENSLSFDGNTLAASGLRIFNNTPQSGDLPTVNCNNATYKDMFKTGGTTGSNSGLTIQGSYELVKIKINKAKRIGRDTGTGIPGSTGTNGILVVHSASTFYPRKVIQSGNTYEGLYSNELSGATDVDVDCFACLIPDPLNFPNDSATFNTYPDVTVESHSNTYNDPIGRAAKFQCVPFVHHETVNRNGSRDATGYAYSAEFALQWGVGTLENINCNYSAVAGISPLDGEVIVGSFFNGTDYNVKKGSININNIRVNIDIDEALPNAMEFLFDMRTGAGGLEDKPLTEINISNVDVTFGETGHVMVTNFGDADMPINLNNISLFNCSWGVIGGNNNCEGVTFNVNNFTNKGADVLFFADIGGGTRNFSGNAYGSSNSGISGQYRKSLGSTDSLPLLNGALGSANTGGALSVQSVSLNDDDTHIFDKRGYTAGMFTFLVTNTFSNVSKMISCASASGALTELTSAFGGNYALGAGSNPDTDGVINLWVDGTGALNIKNRLGSTRVFTISFLG